MTVNVASLMSGLSEQRRAFHSEADFQLAFAWQIQRQHGGAQDIRGYDCVKDLVRVESFVSTHRDATATNIESS